MTCNYPIYWQNLYDGACDLWCPDAYSHPAKMSVKLCYKILDHLKELGLLKDDSVVLDPMGGIGTTCLCAGAKGYKSISVELEPKFIDLEKQNKEYLERRLYKKLDWTILQGDSRKLSELLKERGLVSVTSPPYENIEILPPGQDPDRVRAMRQRKEKPHYGTTKGQIGNLKDRPLTITSPPYQNTEICIGDQASIEARKKRRAEGNWQGYNPDNPSNIGNLKDKPLTITSPPYEDSIQVSTSKEWKYTGRGTGTAGGRSAHKIENYNEDGQLGKERGETYLSAMLQVYQEIARVSDVLVVVVKNPTRNGKLRRLDLDTIKIIEAAGFQIHCVHRALLFEELEQTDLFGETKKKVKGRMSFFKRLAYQKGSIVADHEDIIIAIKRNNRGVL